MTWRRRALFLDKDGTLLEDVPYNVDPSRMVFMDGGVEGLRSVQAAGYRLVVVSNQSGVARGLFSIDALDGMERGLRALLARHRIRIDGFYWCPHHPDGVVRPYAGDCLCRKPRPGLILQAASELNLDLAESWMVGDILDDVEAGHTAGCRAILVNNGHETEWVLGPRRVPDVIVRDLRQVAPVMLSASPRRMAEQRRRMVGAQ